MTDFPTWEHGFMERQRQARETLAGMQAAKAANLSQAEKTDLIRSIARIAQHGFTVSASGDSNG